VLPPQSKELLPIPYRKIMEEDSPIHSYYPEKYDFLFDPLGNIKINSINTMKN
jgi:5'-3' exonuclease